MGGNQSYDRTVKSCCSLYSFMFSVTTLSWAVSTFSQVMSSPLLLSLHWQGDISWNSGHLSRVSMSGGDSYVGQTEGVAHLSCCSRTGGESVSTESLCSLSLSASTQADQSWGSRLRGRWRERGHWGQSLSPAGGPPARRRVWPTPSPGPASASSWEPPRPLRTGFGFIGQTEYCDRDRSHNDEVEAKTRLYGHYKPPAPLNLHIQSNKNKSGQLENF